MRVASFLFNGKRQTENCCRYYYKGNEGKTKSCGSVFADLPMPFMKIYHRLPEIIVFYCEKRTGNAPGKGYSCSFSLMAVL
jgi:hypothetical protein